MKTLTCFGCRAIERSYDKPDFASGERALARVRWAESCVCGQSDPQEQRRAELDIALDAAGIDSYTGEAY